MTEHHAALDTTATFRAYFSRIFEHDRWANGVVFDSMTNLGEALPQKSLDRLSHLIICQQLWLSRLTDNFEKPDTLFPKWPLDETKQNAKPIFAGMKSFIEELPEEDYHCSFAFASMEGQPYTLLRRDIFTQLGQHGAYHRGQIAMELNPLLDECLTTDYVYYTWMKA